MIDRAGFLRAGGALGAAACIPSAAFAAASTPLISASALRSDLELLWTTMLDVGPDPFRATNRSVVEARYRALRDGLTAPLGVLEFFLQTAQLFALLNDGHVSIGAPAAAFPVTSEPVYVRLFNGEVIALGDSTKTIPKGSRIVSIERVPAATIRDRAYALVGGQTAALREERASGYLNFVIGQLFGGPPGRPYSYEWIDLTGRRGRATLQSPKTRPAVVASPPPEPEPYSFTFIANNTVGYLNYRECVDIDRFRAFLQTTFMSVFQRLPRALIIDIRQNSGGDDALNAELWPCVTTKSFKQAGAIRVRSSPILKRAYGQDKYTQIYGDEAWRAPDGAIVTIPSGDDQLVVPVANYRFRHDGPTYLLIGRDTFSSGMECALAAKDYGLATIVGEETAEPASATGEIFKMTAPNTGLTATFTTKFINAPKPHPDGQGVVPDVIVPTTVADLVTGRDPVLEKTLQLINS